MRKYAVAAIAAVIFASLASLPGHPHAGTQGGTGVAYADSVCGSGASFTTGQASFYTSVVNTQAAIGACVNGRTAWNATDNWAFQPQGGWNFISYTHGCYGNNTATVTCWANVVMYSYSYNEYAYVYPRITMNANGVTGCYDGAGIGSCTIP